MRALQTSISGLAQEIHHKWELLGPLHSVESELLVYLASVAEFCQVFTDSQQSFCRGLWLIPLELSQIRGNKHEKIPEQFRDNHISVNMCVRFYSWGTSKEEIEQLWSVIFSTEP